MPKKFLKDWLFDFLVLKKEYFLQKIIYAKIIAIWFLGTWLPVI